MRHALGIGAALGAAAILGCTNAGEDRLLGISGTAVVSGFVVFDVNGSRTFDPLLDTALANVRIRLLERSTGDSVAGAISPAGGFFKVSGVPIGSYRIVVDTAPFSDTVRVERLDSAEVTLEPGDSTVVNVLISYPHLTIAAARALQATCAPLAVPRRVVFVDGVAHNAPFTFRDTTVHVQDGTAAIRATRLRQVAQLTIGPGDSVRLKGTTCQRDGQATLDDVSVFGFGTVLEPPAQLLTTLEAAGAQGGTRDAQFVFVDGAIIADTLTVGGNFRLTVSDGSGALEVLLDAQSGPGAAWPPYPAAYAPGNTFEIHGLLVKTATPGLWRLKPRFQPDLVQQ